MSLFKLVRMSAHGHGGEGCRLTAQWKTCCLQAQMAPRLPTIAPWQHWQTAPRRLGCKTCCLQTSQTLLQPKMNAAAT